MHLIEYSYRTCGSDGQWQGRYPGDTSGGWTNYTDCYTPESKEIFRMLFENISPQVCTMKKDSIYTVSLTYHFSYSHWRW